MASQLWLACWLLATSLTQLVNGDCNSDGFLTGQLTVTCFGDAFDAVGLFPFPEITLIVCVDCTASSLGHNESFKNVEKISEIRLKRLKLGSQKRNSFVLYNKRGLQKLELTNTRRGDLEELRAHFFGGLQNLTMLNLRHNHIQKIEAGVFSNSRYIDSLLLDYNPLSGLVASSFAGLKNVGLLSIRHASGLLRLRPQVFHGLSHVEKLSIQHCPLKHLETGAFRGLRHVQHIKISHTALEVIREDSFAGIEGTVESLDLSHNQLRSLGSGLVASSWQLQRLNLQHNKLTTLQSEILPSAFLQQASLQLNLQFNPLRCNCELLWLVKFYQRHAQLLQKNWESLLSDTHCTKHAISEPYLGDNAALYKRCESLQDTSKPDGDKDYKLVEVTTTSVRPGQRHVIVENSASATSVNLAILSLSTAFYRLM